MSDIIHRVKKWFKELFNRKLFNRIRDFFFGKKIRVQPPLPPRQPEPAPERKPKPLWKFSEEGEISFSRDTPSPLPEPDFQSVAADLKNALEHPDTIRFPFGLNGSNAFGVHVVHAEDMPDVPIWFLGDVHGDYPALLASCDYILGRDPDAVLCFCGDMIDRGPDCLRTMLWFLNKMLRDMPGRILWIRGNHDIALKYEEDRHCFTSNASPAGFDDLLNAHSEYADFGQDLIRFIQLLPAALFFPDGLLFTHGGIPLTNIKSLMDLPASVQDLNKPMMLSAFCKARIAPGVEYKSAPRSVAVRDYTVGRVNIDDFFRRCEGIGIRANRIVAGHDHPEAGFSVYDNIQKMEGQSYPPCEYLKSVLILYNSALIPSGRTQDSLLSFHAPEDAQPFAVACYKAGELPEVTILHFRESAFNSLYGDSDAAADVAESGRDAAPGQTETET